MEKSHYMAKSEPIEVEATVVTALPNAMFKLKLDSADREILGIVSGKDAQALHPHPARRPRPRRALALRPDARAASSSARSNAPRKAQKKEPASLVQSIWLKLRGLFVSYFRVLLERSGRQRRPQSRRPRGRQAKKSSLQLLNSPGRSAWSSCQLSEAAFWPETPVRIAFFSTPCFRNTELSVMLSSAVAFGAVAQHHAAEVQPLVVAGDLRSGRPAAGAG